MDAIVSILFGTQSIDVFIDDVPEEANDNEIRDEAWDILKMNSRIKVFRQYRD